MLRTLRIVSISAAITAYIVASWFTNEIEQHIRPGGH